MSSGKNKVFFFRADGNGNIGSGHVMRCLSIASAALGNPDIGQIFFITASDTSDNFHRLLASYVSEGIEVITLSTPYNALETEVRQLQELIRTHHPSALFIDSYFVTNNYLYSVWETSRATATKLVYIDDVASFPYPCDVLVNYNIYGGDWEEKYKSLYISSGKRVQCPQLILGSTYAPLRGEFQNLQPRTVKKNATNILISTGGTDFEHLTVSLIDAVLSNPEAKSYAFHFVIGAMNEDAKLISSLASSSHNIVLHQAVKSMSSLMKDSDLAISAAGSTLYELCSTQTPTITYILADNQIPGARGFEKHGILKNCGDVREVGKAALASRLITEAVELAENYEERRRIAERMKSVVDGNGAKRIVDTII